MPPARVPATKVTSLTKQFTMRLSAVPPTAMPATQPPLISPPSMPRLTTVPASVPKSALLSISPIAVSVILNIDADHLDFYRDIDHIEETFGKFLALLPPDGTAIGHGDDPRILRLFSALSVRRLTFGLGEGCDYTPGRLTYDEYGHASFDLCFHGDVLGHIALEVPGEFQVYNALAALACAHSQGADMAMACHAMNEFKGAHRRFELTGEVEGVRLYHDYGHNPTEMRNVLSVARLQPHGRLWAVMQPHTYSRVKRLFDDYLTCTQAADFTLVTDIYAAREKEKSVRDARREISELAAEATEKLALRESASEAFDQFLDAAETQEKESKAQEKTGGNE